eukprot:TRINITY_DN33316_c0_g1_i1.p1 TRINITY_DN33316_c0_g1~~TRINITY_DN33316_c0_g1_i1.p1  ORF type:complete len:429 (+),score=42.18 TRINITY_DN33316_c0_g1_i1:69-1355(+)
MAREMLSGSLSDESGDEEVDEADLALAVESLETKPPSSAGRVAKLRDAVVAQFCQAFFDRKPAALKKALDKCSSQRIFSKADLKSGQGVYEDLLQDVDPVFCQTLTTRRGSTHGGFVSGMHVAALDSGVVRLKSSLVRNCISDFTCLNAASYAVHIPKIMPVSACPVFQSAADAAAFHDAVICAKDGHRKKTQYFINAGGGELTPGGLEAVYGRRLTEYRARCEAAGRRMDQIYLLVPRATIMCKRSGVPFHMSLDDHVRDLGADLSGRKSFVAVGSAGKQFDNPVAAPEVLQQLYAKKAPGIGVRQYNLEPSQWQQLQSDLGLDVPKTLQTCNVSLHVYSVPWDKKGVSPLLMDNSFSLAICGTQCRQSLHKHEGEVRCVITSCKRAIKTIFLVGSMLPARVYHMQGLEGARLIPKRGWKRRAETLT